MNCCQPRHPGLGDGPHAGVEKNWVLSWSEYAEAPPLAVLSMLVTPDTVSNEPSAAEIRPLLTRAAQSVPLPTVCGRRPLTGGYGRSGGVAHATCFHSTRGNSDLKHPLSGIASSRIAVCQSSWVFAIAGPMPTWSCTSELS